MIDYTKSLRGGSGIHIDFPETHWQIILEHCHRALEAFRDGKADEGKAFGLVFGTVFDQVITVKNCFPLQRNVRSQSPYKEYMDKIMDEHAIPSVTPLDQRGWVADPAELFARIKESRCNRQVLIGTYHMHRVGWEHDSLRDTPTTLDAVLAKESGLLMFIISMVEPQRPIIRAFYEGIIEQEVEVKSEKLKVKS
jgi:hypothetical protein